MKKKFLECPRHGLTLFRCKRKVWHTSSGKEDKFLFRLNIPSKHDRDMRLTVELIRN